MQTITKPAVALTKPGKQPAAMGMLIKKAAFVKGRLQQQFLLQFFMGIPNGSISSYQSVLSSPLLLKGSVYPAALHIPGR
jgi:hypothetical protein